MSVFENPIVAAVLTAWPGTQVTVTGGHALVDANEIELAAMAQASSYAGEFIEELGQTDMAKWTEGQWHDFIAAICGGYVDAIAAHHAKAAEALARVQR